jgi:hypothetical protein
VPLVAPVEALNGVACGNRRGLSRQFRVVPTGTLIAAGGHVDRGAPSRTTRIVRVGNVVANRHRCALNDAGGCPGSAPLEYNQGRDTNELDRAVASDISPHSRTY